MKKQSKVFLGALAVLTAVLFTACPPKKKITVIPTNTAPPATDTVPTVDTTVKTDTTDFVVEKKEPVVTEDVFSPKSLDEANRMAQERHYLQDAFFDYNESTLSADAQAALSSSATWLKSAKGSTYNLLIEGHCDERGTEQYNLALGDRRANTAREYLMTLGVDASRIRTVSYGEERPFNSGHDDAAFAQNRRDHLVLVGK